MGHGGTLDPLASGILIIGIGRGTKSLQNYLGCTKTYETVVLFGKSTDTYDVDGKVVEQKESSHVSEALVRGKLGAFRGAFRQMPPMYSALKIDGIKACEYIRAGKELPRELETREVYVDECEVVEWMEAGQHDFKWPDEGNAAIAPAVRIRLAVSSGFYVRSFVHDLGIACESLATMAELKRTRQADFKTQDYIGIEGLMAAITYADFNAEEDVWGPLAKQHLTKWMVENPLSAQTHVNGRDPGTKKRANEEQNSPIKQRFRGGWLATTKKERRSQQKKPKTEPNHGESAKS